MTRRNYALALLDRLIAHRGAKINRIRDNGFFRSEVAIDREVGRYLEGTYHYEAMLLSVASRCGRVDRIIQEREMRREVEAERSLTMDRRMAAAMARPARSVDQAMRQHETFAAGA